MKIFLILLTLIPQILPNLLDDIKNNTPTILNRAKLRKVNSNILLSGPYICDDWNISTSAVLNKKYYSLSIEIKKYFTQEPNPPQPESILKYNFITLSPKLSLGYTPHPRIAIYSFLKYLPAIKYNNLSNSVEALHHYTYLGLGSRIALTQNISLYLEENLLILSHLGLSIYPQFNIGLMFGA